MVAIEGVDVSLIYDPDGSAVDIANHAVITKAGFNSASNANPGDCEVVLRDPDRTLSFTTGKRLKLFIDGQPMWAGYCLIKGGTSFFPAGDGKEDTKARSFVLRGVDNNRLMDARVFRNTANYLKAPPNITVDRYDGYLLRYALANYFDMPSYIDIVTNIDDVQYPSGGNITAAQPWAWPTQGSKLRVLAEDLARWSAAVYYIGPDDAVHYHAVQDRECSWGFSDRPNRAPITQTTPFEGSYIGFRELLADEDGSQLATDAFVWGGSPFAGTGQTVFHRATDTNLEAEHGKWQLAEMHFNETNYKLQKGVDQRAHMIVYGSPTHDLSLSEPGSVVGEGPRGLRFPQWSYTFSWTQKDIPKLSGVRRHLYPGDIVPIQLWAFSEDGGTTPLTKFLPLRSLRISFSSGTQEGKAHVQFYGAFDLRNEDSKFLWKYLRGREPRVANTTIITVTDAATDSPQGGFGQFVPTPAPDGSNTVFFTKFPYIPDTTQLYVNGLFKARGTFYTESDPDTGEITLATPPTVGTELYVTCRTQAG